MIDPPARVPSRAWVVTFAGMSVNLCLGILYAWSVWKAKLSTDVAELVGQSMPAPHDGWTYLSKDQGTLAYSICGLVFALFMIPGGRIQDRYGPKVGATLGGLFLASGCILAGLMKSYVGLILGFGLLGGIGMGMGYAAATPAAVKWFGPQQRGLIVGIVVGGYGAAAIYIAPLADYLIEQWGLSASFISLGMLFALVVIVAGQLLSTPPAGYVPPLPPTTAAPNTSMTRLDWSAPKMMKTWQFYALVLLFVGSAQSGLLVIANAKSILKQTASTDSFAWLLASFGGLVNATGRIGTGLYSDRIGRANAYLINGLLSAVCLCAIPTIITGHYVAALFVVVGFVYWQYGGGLALMPAFTADYFGAKNLGFNYGLVFVGWGIAFFIPQLAGYIETVTAGRLDLAFYISGGLLLVAVIASRMMFRPLQTGE